MKRSRLSRLILFLIWGFWATAGVYAFSLGAGGNGTATLSAGQGFGPKMQYGGGFSVDFVFPLRPWILLDASMEGFTVAPSDVSGGFLYRGYSGGAAALMAQFLPTIVSTPELGVMRAGGGAGMAAALPSYWYTTLAFFYLEPRVEGLVDWTPAGLSAFTFQLSLPVAMQLRRDMSYSFSAGLRLGALYSFGATR
jgi:hypothetical protein